MSEQRGRVEPTEDRPGYEWRRVGKRIEFRLLPRIERELRFTLPGE